MEKIELFDSLSRIKEELFDASSEVKNAFNTVCKYFDSKSKYETIRDEYVSNIYEMHPKTRAHYEKALDLVTKYKGVTKQTPVAHLRDIINQIGNALYERDLSNGLSLMSAYRILRELGIKMTYDEVCQVCGFRDNFDKPSIDGWNKMR